MGTERPSPSTIPGQLHLEVNRDATALATAYIRSGDRAAGERLLDQMIHMSATKYVSPVNISLVYAELGDMDRAFEWFQKGYNDQSEEIIFFHVEPFFDTMRRGSRFTDLVHKAGLPA